MALHSLYLVLNGIYMDAFGFGDGLSIGMRVVSPLSATVVHITTGMG